MRPYNHSNDEERKEDFVDVLSTNGWAQFNWCECFALWLEPDGCTDLLHSLVDLKFHAKIAIEIVRILLNAQRHIWDLSFSNIVHIMGLSIHWILNPSTGNDTELNPTEVVL